MVTKNRMREDGFPFTASHLITVFPEGHRDRVEHVHVFRIVLEVLVEIDDVKGYAFDHRLIVDAGRSAAAALDGKRINDIPGLERGLCDDILNRFLVPRLRADLEHHGCVLSTVELHQRSDDFGHIKIWRIEDQLRQIWSASQLQAAAAAAE